MVTFWELLALAGTVLIFLYSYYRKSYLTAYFVGIIFGSMWEIATESLFNYNAQNFGLFVWQDIPLAIILGWGVVIAGFQIISDILQKKYKIKPNTLKSVLSDAFVAGSLGAAMEYLGSHNSALWSYPPTALPLIAGVPVIWPIGWIVIGVLNLSFARRLEAFKPE